MTIPEVFTGSCRDDECTQPAEIAGWCPAHALVRYRQQAVRSTPERWTRYYARPKCVRDGCRMYALKGQTRCRYHPA